MFYMKYISHDLITSLILTRLSKLINGCFSKRKVRYLNLEFDSILFLFAFIFDIVFFIRRWIESILK